MLEQLREGGGVEAVDLDAAHKREEIGIGGLYRLRP
jgi:hypothetical protein